MRLEGTVRCFSVATRNRVEQALQRYAEQTAAIYGGTASLDYQYGTLPVINDEQDALFAQTLIKENFGEAALRQEEPTTGGEDFSYYTEHASGCFALVGSGNPEKDTSGHITMVVLILMKMRWQWVLSYMPNMRLNI